MRHRIALLLFTLPVATGSLAAQDRIAGGEAPKPWITVEDPQDVTLEKYAPHQYDSRQLAPVLEDLLGRQLTFPDGRTVANVMVLGNELLLYDTRERIQAMLAALEELDPPQDEVQERKAAIALDPDRAVLRTFRPRYADLRDLLETALSLEGRLLAVGDDVRPNLTELGDTLVVYDEEARAARILDLLEELDRGAAATGPPLEVLTWRPRHVPLRNLERALQPFQRTIVEPGQWRGSPGSSARNISVVDDQGVLVVRDSPDRLARIQALLEEVDQPRPQGLLTCLVLRAAVGAGGKAPPREVVEALARVLPDVEFVVDAAGLLRTSLGPVGELRQELASATGQRYLLELRLGAWDAESGALDLARCSFALLEDEEEPQEVFTTAPTIYAGEYAVIGAVGADPLLLVLQVQPVR